MTNKFTERENIYVTRWYDNEWGYSNRCVDLAIFIGKRLKNSDQSDRPKAAAARS